MNSSCKRFTPSLESLDERLNPAALVPTGTVTFPTDGIAVTELSGVVYQSRPVGETHGRTDSIGLGVATDRAELEGHQALVFFLGGTPSRAGSLSPDDSAAPDGRKYKMLVAPLVIDLDGAPAIRHRLFAVVDRTQLAEGVVILTASLPGGDASTPQGTLLIAKQQALRIGEPDHIDIAAPIQIEDSSARYFNGFVSRFSAGAADETITIHGNRTENTRSNVFAVWLTVG